MTEMTSKRFDPLSRTVITNRAAVPAGLDLSALPDRLAEAVTTYAGRLRDLEVAHVRGLELVESLNAARAADQQALTDAVRRGEEPTSSKVTKEDRARMAVEGHQRKITAMETVADEAGAALVREASSALPEVEVLADRASAEASDRVTTALREVREALVERERQRAALRWAGNIAAGRPGKVPDENHVVGEALRGVEQLLGR
jgi:hypothetical protein